jgi:hypothetical protein
MRYIVLFDRPRFDDGCTPPLTLISTSEQRITQLQREFADTDFPCPEIISVTNAADERDVFLTVVDHPGSLRELRDELEEKAYDIGSVEGFFNIAGVLDGTIQPVRRA